MNTLLRVAMHELLLDLYGQHELFERYAMHEYLIGPCNT